MAAIACATERVRLGPMVTPLARRRPWKLAREVGDARPAVGRAAHVRRRPRRRPAAGELSGPRRGDRCRCAGRALLDERLDVCVALWSGEEVHHRGERVRRSTACASGRRRCSGRTRRSGSPAAGPNKAPLRRAARYQGYFPVEVDSPDQLAELRRGAAGPTAAGLRRRRRRPAERDPRPFEAAGATWWLVGFDPFTVTADEARSVGRAGPPRREPGAATSGR